MKRLTAHGSVEQAVFPTVEETKTGKESHTDVSRQEGPGEVTTSSQIHLVRNS